MKSLIVSALLLTVVPSAFGRDGSDVSPIVVGGFGQVDSLGSEGRPTLPPGFPGFPGFPSGGPVVILEPIGSEGRPEVDPPVVVAPKPAAKKFVYLRCNSTSWELNPSNLLSEAGEGYSLTYKVKEQWMLDSGESCVVTVTDKKGKWTPKTKEYIAPLANGEVAIESNSYTLLSAKAAKGNTFRVRYSSLGDYTAYFNVKTKQFYVMKLYFHGN